MASDKTQDIANLSSKFREILVGLERERRDNCKKLVKLDRWLLTGESGSRKRSSTASTMNVRGALIVLEGLDQAGRSTTAIKLAEHLEMIGKNVSLCKFPEKTTPVGRLIDEFLRAKSRRLDNHVINLMFSANRWELAKKIKNTINQGTTVVVDRYSYSDMAHGSAKQDISLKWASELERGLPKPDLVIYLELPRETQNRRQDLYDDQIETVAMQDRVRLQYERVMDMSNETWLRVNVDKKSQDRILGEIIMPVKRCLEACSMKELGCLDFLQS